MRNERNRRLKRVEPQSPDGKENFSETSIVQGTATLTNVYENADILFDRNPGSELTEPSQVSNEIEVNSQRLVEQTDANISQIEQHLNSTFEQLLIEIRTNKNCEVTNRENDGENESWST